MEFCDFIITLHIYYITLSSDNETITQKDILIPKGMEAYPCIL